MTDSYLLTPGPLTTSDRVKRAALKDWGSRDADFIALTQSVRTRLLDIANATTGYTTVPVQGSGTFAVEAMLGTFAPPDAKTLVLVNGAYGRRIAEILEILERPFDIYETDEVVAPSPEAVSKRLAADPGLACVVMVHCETTSGIQNPLSEIARIVRSAGRQLLVDAMSTFGAIPIDAGSTPFAALAASANKCLQGVPGVGFVICDTEVLETRSRASHSLSLDLWAQWRGFEGNGQWRFTPPTHVLACLAEALDELEAEGGPESRVARYRKNCDLLISGMAQRGFRTLVPRALQAPIIVTFESPTGPDWDFEAFYQALKARGYSIYPGKLTKLDSFRIGCIGALDQSVFEGVLTAIDEAYAELRDVCARE
ncbi:MAG: 2-aminoethylphosphonate--pyruvate transaminase [Gammaproteobacteria bacterium]